MANLSCLIVEDSPMMRQLLVQALVRLKGLAITEAEDGVAALKRIRSTRFDIVITDINMPVMDGLKLIQSIRSDEVHAEAPIVVITTENSPADRDRAIALGASAYITKPIQASEVLAAVGKLLGVHP
jgi:two-component system chemotaxis response regulator CheY